MIPGSANPLLLKSAAAAGGYQIERSLRFNSSDSASLSRASYAGSGTFSCWVKRCKLGTAQTIISGVAFNSSDQLNSSTAVFRDPSALMHVLVSTSGTYVNNTLVASGSAITPGIIGSGCDLYLADIHFIDGQALTPSSFTEVSATTGQLIPKAYTGTFTGNSFWLKFADNSAATATTLGKDSSGLGNNWTPNNFSVASTGVNYTSGTTFPADAINTSSLFDGNDANGTNFGGLSGGSSPSGTTRTFSFTNLPSVTSSLRLKVYNGEGAGSTVKVNNGTPVTIPNNYPSGAYYTISGFTGAINSVTYTYGGGNLDQAMLMGIEIDGVLIADFKASNNDSLVDTPTSYGTDTGAGGEVRGNYCTLNPLQSGLPLSNGNLDAAHDAGDWKASVATFGVSSGKWYWEVTSNSNAATGITHIGIVPTGYNATAANTYIGNTGTSYAYRGDGTKYTNNTATSYGSTIGSGTVVGVALNLDAGTLTFYNNGVSQGTAFSSLSGTFFPAVSHVSTSSSSVNFGQRAFAYTPPANHKALVDTNLPSPVVAKPNTLFDVVTYTGNGSTQTISGLAFSPDFVWYKSRVSATFNHGLFDIVRGAQNFLASNSTAAEVGSLAGVSAFNSDGFTLGSDAGGNTNAASMVAWAWDAGTSTVSNTQGSITSQVRANPSAGFSVVTFTSPTGTGNFSAGHGLGVTPEFVIVKSRDAAGVWYVYHKSLATDHYLRLNGTNASATDGVQWGAGMTSSVLGLRASYSTVSGATTVAYAWTPVVGYSSFGSYTGNGSADGPFVFCGFRPRWVLIKNTTGSNNWELYDAARDPNNVVGKVLLPNTSDAEITNAGATPGVRYDFLSNGFKLRDSQGSVNGSGNTIIFAAFAESPFQYARAR